MSESVVPSSSKEPLWTIVVDDTCPVVERLGWLVRQWDRHHTFAFIGRDSKDSAHADVIGRLDHSPWSLLLLDREGNQWHGPEAIPFILKNLPSGKIAAVWYTLPGTMWLTRQLYLMVSRNRRLLHKSNTSTTLADRAA